MQKAADEMKAQMKKRQEEKENYLRSKVQPLSIDGLDDGRSNVLVAVSCQLEGCVCVWRMCGPIKPEHVLEL